MPFTGSGVKVTPAGRDPARVTVGTGLPTVVISKLSDSALPKLTAAALVKAGAPSTVSVRVWVTAGKAPLPPVSVNG